MKRKGKVRVYSSLLSLPYRYHKKRLGKMEIRFNCLRKVKTTLTIVYYHQPPPPPLTPPKKNFSRQHFISAITNDKKPNKITKFILIFIILALFPPSTMIKKPNKIHIDINHIIVSKVPKLLI